MEKLVPRTDFFHKDRIDKQIKFIYPLVFFLLKPPSEAFQLLFLLKTAHRPSPKRFFHHAQRGHAANLKNSPPEAFPTGNIHLPVAG